MYVMNEYDYSEGKFTELDEERNSLNEMALRIISAKDDGLPFKLIVKSPDKGRFDRVHIIKYGTKCEELGAFVITKEPPQAVSDLIPYTDGNHKGLKNISARDQEKIVKWATMKNSKIPICTNWQMLQYEYDINRRDY